MKVMKKPNLYQGRPLPLADLTANSFEDFTHQILIELGNKRGFEIISGPQNSSDYGFDLVGRRISDGNLICIQCKRYNSSSVGLPTVSEELAKVAMNSHLEGSTVKEHYVLTTGSLTKDLNSNLRSTKRKNILESCLESLEKDSLKNIVKKCKEKNLNVKKIVTDYIYSLEKIIVWSGRDIDNNLGSIWSKIEDIIEKHFKLERVLREYPRPDFDVSNYINEITTDDENLIELISTPTVLPPNISKIDPEKFNNKATEEFEFNDFKPIISDHLLSKVPNKHSILLTGQGGAGKTTILTHFQEVLSKKFENTGRFEVPIYIKLAGFRTNLDDLIHDSLGITYGHWSSLPYNFFLLLDGLDEISTNDINLFTSQFNRILKRHDIKAIISLRTAGLRLPIYMPNISGYFSLNKLNFRQIIKFSESILNQSDSKIFVDILLNKANSLGSRTFTLPFGLMVALDYFKTHKNLPDNLYDIIMDIIKRRIDRNKSRPSSIDSSINLVSENTIYALAESLAFEVRVILKKAALYKAEVENAIVAALNRLKKRNIFGASSLSDEIAFSISDHYEMQRNLDHNLYVMDHDLISDCLSAKLLAEHWKDYIDQAGDKIGWDAWTFASRFVVDSDQNDFLQRMLKQDLALAARCFKEMDEGDIKIIEREIESNAKDSSLHLFANAMYAASILKSNYCIKLLNESLSEKDPHRKYNTKRFLSISGDEKFLKEILKENELAKACSLNPSGGTFDMWFEAPVKVITKIAREQIDKYLFGKVPHVPISLETLELYGDNTDFYRVEEVFNKTENSVEFYISSRCLLAFDVDLAVKILKSKAQNLEDKFGLKAMNVLNGYGFSFNIAPLFKRFLATKELKNHEEIIGFKDITEILSSNTLPIDAAEKLLKHLDNLDLTKNKITSLYQFYNIWQIATTQKYIEFSDKALEQLDDGTIPELSVSLTYCNELLADSPKRSIFIEKCLTQLRLKLDEEIPTFPLIRSMLKILFDFGEQKNIIKSAEKLLKRHTSKYFQILKNEIDKENDLTSMYKLDFPEILTSLINIKHELDSKLLIDLVGTDVCSRSKEIKHAYCEILNFLPRDIVENKISKIKDPFIKIESLGCLLNLKKNSSTKELFIENIQLMFTDHFYYPNLIKFSEIYWGDDVKNTIFESFIRFDWGPHQQILVQTFQKVMEELSFLFNQNDIETLFIPAKHSIKNQFTIYLIDLWIEFIKK
ncbi:MAG: NACHT domain-containing protein [Desulfobacterales bacterium]|nr:NACHT domain-containing protein [Desulfobacterales bacterium]